MRRIANEALLAETTWTHNGLSFRELVRQSYENSAISAGTVEGAGVDTVYFRWQKDSDEGGMLLLRPDEVAAISYVASAVTWSWLIAQEA